MTGYRIAPSGVSITRAKPKSDEPYLDYIRTLPCVVCGRPAEAAHLSTGNRFYGHHGRGTAQRAADRWAMPLCPYHHRNGRYAQHKMGEKPFWISVGKDAYKLSLILQGLWLEHGPDAEEHARKVIMEQIKC